MTQLATTPEALTALNHQKNPGHAGIVKNYTPDLHNRFMEAKGRNGDAWSLRNLARLLDSSEAAVSKYCNKKPEGDVAKLERYVEALLVNDHLHQTAPPVDGELFETPVVRQLGNLCKLALKHRFIRAFIGDPGMGKSCARTLYMLSDPMAVHMELNRVKMGGRVVALERVFLKHCTMQNWDKRAEPVGEYILRNFREMQRLVLLDNAHLLSRQGLEWVLGFHDETQCPIILIGNSELKYTLELVQRAPSRVGAPIEARLQNSRDGACALKTPRDVARRFLEINWSIAADELTDVAAEVISSFGSLRSLRHITVMAKDWNQSNARGCETPLKAFEAARNKQIPKTRLSLADDVRFKELRYEIARGPRVRKD